MQKKTATRRQIIARLSAAQGRPLRIPVGPAVELLNELLAQDMTKRSIAEQANANGFALHRTALSHLGKFEHCHRYTLDALQSVKPTPDPWKAIPPIGGQRIAQGLVHAGFTQWWISLKVSDHEDRDYANNLLRGRVGEMRLSTYETLLDLGHKYELIDPVSVGVHADKALMSRNFARRNEWAPLNCWDDDTLRDPSAVPQYTGECGTVAGYRRHRSIGDRHWDAERGRYTLGCRACRTARSEFRYANGRNP